MEVPWEPYGSFPYLVAWPFSKQDWLRLGVDDDGEMLHNWHHATLAESLSALTAEEITAVEAHRERSYGRSPLDRPVPLKPNLVQFVK
jgi:hypothetical protein